MPATKSVKKKTSLNNPLSYLTIGVVGVLTVASGIMQGQISHRWGPRQDSHAAAKNLLALPEEIGDWQSRQSHDLSESVQEMLQCTAHVNREYVNSKTGESVQVAILLGPPGPTAVHTPEICYSSRDYKIIQKREIVSFGAPEGSRNEFWSLEFQASELDAFKFRVYYAWSNGDQWVASESPRFEFAGSPYLYKIQLASRPVSTLGNEDIDPCRDFLHDLLPLLKRYLVNASSS